MKARLALAALLACLASAAGGWWLRGDHEAARQLEATIAAALNTAEGQTEVDDLAQQQAAVQTEQIVKDRIITKEVIRYVQVTAPADRCTLPGAWRVRHDAAATGTPAESAGVAADPAATVTDAAALDTVGDNYIACRHYIEQVKGWQQWWETAKNYCVSP